MLLQPQWADSRVCGKDFHTEILEKTIYLRQEIIPAAGYRLKRFIAHAVRDERINYRYTQQIVVARKLECRLPLLSLVKDISGRWSVPKFANHSFKFFEPCVEAHVMRSPKTHLRHHPVSNGDYQMTMYMLVRPA